LCRFTPAVFLVSASVDAAQTVFLNFNPSLSASQDIWFYFTVTGPLSGVGFGLGGIHGVSTELVCSQPVIIGGLHNNQCPAGTQLASMYVTSSGSDDKSFQTVSTAYIFKNIGVNNGELSSMTQSFHTVPEPLTFVLIGTGLVGLGLIRRRARKS